MQAAASSEGAEIKVININQPAQVGRVFSASDQQCDVAARNEMVVRDLKAALRQWWAQFAGRVDLTAPRTRVPVPSPEELEKKHYRN